MKKDKNYNAAKKLRIAGYSIKEIGRKFNISPSTASIWLRNAKISKIGKRRIAKRQDIGRHKGAATNKKKHQESLKIIADNCGVLKEKKRFDVDVLKIFLSLLYWCEGSKTGNRVTFTNSDPKMIKIFLAIFRKSFLLKENKIRAVLHLHDYHDKEKMLRYWSIITGIEKRKFIIYNKENTGKRKKIGYNGCLSVNYCDVRILEEIFLIIRRFIICLD